MNSSTSLNEKSSFSVIVEHDEAQEHRNNHLDANNVFDTPKTSLSRSTTEERIPQHPARPCPVAKGSKGLLRVETGDTQPDLEKGFLSPTPSGREGGLSPLYSPCKTYSMGCREGGLSPLYSPCKTYSINSRVKECSVWPSKQTLKAKAQKEKHQRRRANCFGLSGRWGGLSKKQRLWIKILIGLIVAAFAVGIAIGITRAVGGGVWSGNNHNKQIPDSH